MLATTVLDTLRCYAGSSRPYLWTELLIVDDNNTLATNSHGNLDVRTVLTDHLGPGGAVAVPESVKRLGARFDTGGTRRILILVVVLLDKRDTPAHAMAAGHTVFLSEVRDQVARYLLELNASNGPSRERLIADIKKRVSDRVTAAVIDALSALDKAFILANLDKADQLIASAFQIFDQVNPPSAPFSLQLQGRRQDGVLIGGRPAFNDDYQLDGTLLVTDDPCEQQLIDIRQINHEIANINGRMAQLRRGEPTREEERELDALLTRLLNRQAKLKDAQNALAACRTQHGVVGGDPAALPSSGNTVPVTPVSVPVTPVGVRHPRPDTGGGGGRRPPRQEP